MACSTKPWILDMPNEILLHIFHLMPTVLDACNFAKSCSRLYESFTTGRNRIAILRSAAGVPQRPYYSLKNAFSVLIRISPLYWLLEGERRSTGILIEVDYDTNLENLAAFGVLDMIAIQRVPSNRGKAWADILAIFLAQFHQLDRRCNKQFEPATYRILSAAARLQTDLLRESPDVVTDLSTETTLIALTLHCFMVIRDISLIHTHSVPCTERQLFGDGPSAVIVEPDDRDPYIPTIRVEKYKWRRGASSMPGPTEKIPGFHLYSGLDTMIEYIARLSYELLNTQDPRHWSTLLHVLVILDHIVDTLKPSHQWMRKMDEAGQALDPGLSHLIRYYYVSTDGGQLLSNHWDEKEYGRRVGGDKLSIEHARALNRLWLQADGGRYDRCGVKDFGRKIAYFATGCFHPKIF